VRVLDVILVVGLVFVHLLVHVGLGVGSGAPDLFLLAVLILARRSHTAVAALVGLGLGLLEDAQGLLGFGANALALSLVGALGARTRDLFVGETILFAGSYLFLGKWVRDLVQWVAVGAGNRPDFVQAVVVSGVVAALYVAAVGLALDFVTGAVTSRDGLR
jgi:cell shape-determining protein MreD